MGKSNHSRLSTKDITQHYVLITQSEINSLVHKFHITIKLHLVNIY